MQKSSVDYDKYHTDYDKSIRKIAKFLREKLSKDDKKAFLVLLDENMTTTARIANLREKQKSDLYYEGKTQVLDDIYQAILNNYFGH
jgi:hypothetical protein